MRRTGFLALAAALACQAPAGPERQRPPAPAPPASARAALVVRDAQAAAAAPVVQLAGLDRFQVDLACSGLADPGPFHVDVTSPRGLLYAQLPATLQLDAQGNGTASATLPVGGTPIETYRMVGTWQFALKGGSGAPLATAAIDLQ
ncbi:MAG TPA: hypothetical protein VLU43_12695 [Anaeromyxobacteraceae bacterium]|nr:hypothetical protein [Anaeromyxobacteraceae bacterium]